MAIAPLSVKQIPVPKNAYLQQLLTILPASRKITFRRMTLIALSESPKRVLRCFAGSYLHPTIVVWNRFVAIKKQEQQFFFLKFALPPPTPSGTGKTFQLLFNPPGSFSSCREAAAVVAGAIRKFSLLVSSSHPRPFGIFPARSSGSQHRSGKVSRRRCSEVAASSRQLEIAVI